jgi:hypothetical protein
MELVSVLTGLRSNWNNQSRKPIMESVFSNRFSVFRFFKGEKPKTENQKLTTGLSLGELEASASALLSVFLTFLATRVACDKAGFLQAWAKIWIEFNQGSRNTVTHSASLTRYAAAINIDQDVELIDRIGQLQGLTNNHSVGFTFEVIFNAALINGDLAGAGSEENPRGRGFATTRSVILNRIWHYGISYIRKVAQRQFALPYSQTKL